MPSFILRTIYISLIQSNLNYSITAWGFNCGRLKKIQKKAIRIVCNSKYLAHSSPLLKKTGILKLEDLFKLNMLKWYHKYVNKKLPKYFLEFEIKSQHEIHEHDTRANSFPPPVPRLHCVRRCIRNYISSIINSTPTNVIEKVHTHSLKGFSQYAKNHYLSNYSTTCTLENCYSCSRV